MQTECPHCGKGNPAGNRHCMFCGKPLTESAPEKPEQGCGWAGTVGRYVLAVLACAGIVALYTLVCMLFGWKHGGGYLPIAMELAFMALVWRKITRR